MYIILSNVCVSLYQILNTKSFEMQVYKPLKRIRDIDSSSIFDMFHWKQLLNSFLKDLKKSHLNIRLNQRQISKTVMFYASRSGCLILKCWQVIFKNMQTDTYFSILYSRRSIVLIGRAFSSRITLNICFKLR